MPSLTRSFFQSINGNIESPSLHNAFIPLLTATIPTSFYALTFPSLEGRLALATVLV